MMFKSIRLLQYFLQLKKAASHSPLRRHLHSVRKMHSNICLVLCGLMRPRTGGVCEFYRVGQALEYKRLWACIWSGSLSQNFISQNCNFIILFFQHYISWNFNISVIPVTAMQYLIQRVLLIFLGSRRLLEDHLRCERCRSLILVMNYIVLCAFVGWFVDCVVHSFMEYTARPSAP